MAAGLACGPLLVIDESSPPCSGPWSILLYAVNVMRSAVLEKTSRVVEIMASAVKPWALMLGKILGVGTVGLLQLSIWAILCEVMLSLAVLILCTAGVVYLAARIDRVGILMYGKRPTLRELARWLRYQ